MDALGTQMPEFKVEDTNGDTHSNYPVHPRGTLVMFLSNHCPFVIHLKSHLAALTQRYATQINIYGIMSNDIEKYPADGPNLMAEDARKFGYCFPYLFDETQQIAKGFKAACTPDFFLYDGHGKLVYRGQYDASRPGNGIPVTGTDLDAALAALVQQREINTNQAPSLGCNIKWRPGNEPDYFS